MDNNITDNKTNDDMIIDTSSKDYAMDALQKKKELYERMKSEVEAAQQANEQFHQQMRDEDMDRPIEDYSINEYGEIVRPSRSR